MEISETERPPSPDGGNDAFWEELSEAFKAAAEQLREIPERYGKDPDAPEGRAADREEEKDEEVARSHECCRSAMMYNQLMNSWFHQAKDLFWEEEYGDPDEDDALESAGPYQPADALQDALDVVRWYQHQIYDKLVRAVRSRLRETREENDGFAKDSDGSAKVALIGIDRSLGAWEDIRKHFPVLQNLVEDLEAALHRLRSNVEESFPEARAFIRPGFDRIPLNG